MARVLIKNSGIFIFEDYKGSRVTKHLSDLQIDKIHPLRRHKTSEIYAYMVSEDWYQSAIVVPSAIFDSVSSSNLAVNFPMYVDIINGKAQTKDLEKRVIEEGPRFGDYKGYAIIDVLGFTSFDWTYLRNTKRGTTVARLLSPAHYNAIIL